MEINLIVWRKQKNKLIQKWWIYYDGKSTSEHPSLFKQHSLPSSDEGYLKSKHFKLDFPL